MNSPMICPEAHVEEGWIDYNGHMNMAYYNVAFDRGVDYLFDQLGIGVAYVESSSASLFTLEAHVHYIGELKLHDAFEIHVQLLDFDAKRIHFVEQMFHVQEGYLAAVSENMVMHVDMNTRRSAPFPDEVQQRLETLMADHAPLDVPPQVGKVMGIRRK